MLSKPKYFFVPFFVLLFSITPNFLKALDFHPYHVGSVEINYNSKSKTFQITGRFFLDDLENALGKKYDKSYHFNDEKYKTQISEALKKYCFEYLKLKVNTKFLQVNYIGYEEDNESVDVFMESEPVDKPQKIETAISFLYNLFDDQINIVHIVMNDKRKSEKLVYPNRYLFQVF